MALILRWCIAGRIMSLLDFWFPLTTSPGPGTLDPYLAEHPVGNARVSEPVCSRPHLGLGSLTGQRTITAIALIALEIIVTPLLAGIQIPYFINGQRLIVGVAMDQLLPAGLVSANTAGGPGQLLLGGHGALGTPPMPTWAMIAHRDRSTRLPHVAHHAPAGPLRTAGRPAGRR